MEYPEKYIPANQLQDFTSLSENYAQQLNVPVKWLYAVMWTESRYNPASGNSIGYGGLIGFGPAAAAEQGTTVSYLKSLSAVQQLPYVLKYFQRSRNEWKNYSDFYLQVFYPAAIGKPKNYIFGSESKDPTWSGKVAKQNPAFDLNKDGLITKGEFDQWIHEHFPDFRISLPTWLKYLLAGIAAVGSAAGIIAIVTWAKKQ